MKNESCMHDSRTAAVTSDWYLSHSASQPGVGTSEKNTEKDDGTKINF